MILQEEFNNNGYVDLLSGDIASAYGIDLEDLFDADQRPEELLGIYIHKEYRDELFFLLDGDLRNVPDDKKPIDTLCNYWDDKIRVFMIINGKKGMIRKLKYNVVQLIVYSGDAPDKSREGNLEVSRKIMIRGNLSDKNRIEIDKNEVLDLPFYMIEENAFETNTGLMEELKGLIPEDTSLLNYMKEKHKREQRKKSKKSEDVWKKSFTEKDFNKIKEWLKDDNS